MDLNHRPRGYESRATNQLSYLGVVLPQGLEPWTRWLRVSYSNLLSYESIVFISAPAGTRTLNPQIKSLQRHHCATRAILYSRKDSNLNLQIRSLMFYSIELREQIKYVIGDPRGIRTLDPEIKSFVLYQLSYEVIAVAFGNF